MKKISVYFSSLLLVLSATVLNAQDTIPFYRKIKIGADIFGPGYYVADRNNMTFEGFLSVDIDTNRAIVFEAGYNSFKYSQYNYDYVSGGMFFRAGMDFNLLSHNVSLGKYYGGIGLRYGVAVFRDEVPWLKYENNWGTVTSSIPEKARSAHFIEVSPGVRTELFKNFSIGWAVRLRVLLYPGKNNSWKPVGIPGYGNGTKSFSPGLNYYLIWSIPYSKK